MENIKKCVASLMLKFTTKGLKVLTKCNWQGCERAACELGSRIERFWVCFFFFFVSSHLMFSLCVCVCECEQT